MVIDLINKLRFSNPWRFKAPLLLCWPYLLIYVTDTPKVDSLLFIALAYCTLFGIAALGYFINDIADITSDKAAGKPNKIGELPVVLRILIFVALLLIAFIPWIWLPKDAISLTLIIIEFFLFIIYSSPPFRLKEKGVLGVITDSLYAYVVPATLASITFFYVGNKNYQLFLELIIVSTMWLFMVGLRGILLHQLQDHQNDLNAGVKTFVTKKGYTNVENLVKGLLQVEILFFLLFLIFLLPELYLIIPCYILFLIIRLHQLRKNGEENDYRKFSYRLLDDFYLDFLPVLILIHLALVYYLFLFILIAHLILFRSFIRTIIKRFIR